jgi:CarD family transcriptional regulator
VTGIGGFSRAASAGAAGKSVARLPIVPRDMVHTGWEDEVRMKTSVGSTVAARLAKAPPPLAPKGKAAGPAKAPKIPAAATAKATAAATPKATAAATPKATAAATPKATAAASSPSKAARARPTAKPAPKAAAKPLDKPKASVSPAPAIKPSAKPKIQDLPTPVTTAKPAAAPPASTPAPIVAPPVTVAAPPVTMSAPPVNRPHQQPMSNGRPVPPPRAAAKEENFVEGDHVVYPTHGVGKVEKINVEDIAGHRLELIHITFEENRMTLRVPVAKARSAGLRKLATRKMFDEALAVLKGRARIKRTMWSRRAQEYEAKINSGDPIAIAEVVRDLHRNAGQPDQSFSERQIYEAAMDRLAAELGALDQSDKATAVTKLAGYLKTIA